MQANPEHLKTEARTLQLRHPPGKTFWLTGFLLLIFFGGGEIIARQEFFQTLFIAPGIGSPHRQFEVQLGRLKERYQEQGKIDCIITGSSTVQEGFDPLLFQVAVAESSGENLSCYNFGLDGLTAAGAGVIARLLVDVYQPRIFIYGTDPRDYIYPIDAGENTGIIHNPWVQYRLGTWNWSGWLFEHSSLLQYQKPIRQLLELRLWELNHFAIQQDTDRWGHTLISTPRVNVARPPIENTDTHYVTVYYYYLANYQIFPENIRGLEEVIAQQKRGVQVLVVEMPVAPGYADFLPNGSKDYQMWVETIRAGVNDDDVPFLHPLAEIDIPITGWNDYNHLNREGIEIFSKWLGIKVVELTARDNH